MGLFGKKKEEYEEMPELPDLPGDDDFSLPSLSSLNMASPPGLEGVEVNSLPALPGSNDEKMRRDEIKKEIVYPGMQRSSGFKSLTGNTGPIIEPPPVSTKRNIDSYAISRTKKVEPIYVRLDKFETTVEAFEGIKNKIMDIERLLVTIKEIKLQEEKELAEWENEIQAIKARIESIDKGIFGKLD